MESHITQVIRIKWRKSTPFGCRWTGNPLLYFKNDLFRVVNHVSMLLSVRSSLVFAFTSFDADFLRESSIAWHHTLADMEGPRKVSGEACLFVGLCSTRIVSQCRCCCCCCSWCACAEPVASCAVYSSSDIGLLLLSFAVLDSQSPHSSNVTCFSCIRRCLRWVVVVAVICVP